MAPSGELVPYIDAVFPARDEEDWALLLRRGVALWLHNGEFRYPSNTTGYQSSMYFTGHFLNITFCDIWQDKGRSAWRCIADFLHDPASHGVFEVVPLKEGDRPTEGVRLNPTAVRAAAAAAGGPVVLKFDEESPDPLVVRDRIVKAVGAAWPGKTVVAAFRRRVALELAAMRDGPMGPYSCLSAAFTSRLRTVCGPDLVARVSAINSTGRLSLKQLLAGPREGGPKDEVVTAAHVLLRCVQLPYDACAVLDLPALLEWYESGGGSGAGTSRAAAAAAKLQRAGVNINLSGLVPRYGTPGADMVSQYASGGGAATSPGGDCDAGGGVLLSDLAYMAFPGTAAASMLRRALAARLAAAKGGDGEEGGGAEAAGGGDMPPFAIPWRLVAPMVAASRAAALQPSLRQPAAFRAFLLHPASGGAFDAARLQVRSAAGAAPEAVDCVTLNPQALRRQAAVGVAAAIATAWPGSDDMSKLRRAAAQVLSGVPKGVDGPYTFRSGLIGAEIKKRQPAAFSVQGGANKGLFTRLHEGGGKRTGGGDSGGYLLYVREEAKEGFLHLKMLSLVRDFPPDTGQDLGLRPEPTASTSAAAPATGHSNGGATSAARQQGHSATSDAEFAIAFGSFGGPGEAGGADPWASMGPPPEAEEGGDGSFQYGAAYEYVEEESYQDQMGGGYADSPASPAEAQPAAPAAPAGPPVEQLPVVLLPTPVQTWVREVVGFNAMLRHCHAVAQMGLAVHAHAGRALVVALYAPAASTASDGGNSAWDAYGNPAIREPATVYLFRVGDILGGGSSGGGGDGADSGGVPGAAARLCGLLESAQVPKVVHGCESAACLAAALGGCALSPLLDTRVLLRGLTAMMPGPGEGGCALPPVPPPPPPYAAVGPMAAVAMAGLSSHLSALQAALAGTGLWADRPELLAALAARHGAALREEMFGVRDWDSNPAAHESSLVAAARHLPELYEAMQGEALPWVAMAAAATAAAKATDKHMGSGGRSL